MARYERRSPLANRQQTDGFCLSVGKKAAWLNPFTVAKIASHTRAKVFLVLNEAIPGAFLYSVLWSDSFGTWVSEGVLVGDSYRMKFAGVGIGLTAVLAVRLYYLQEMIVALVMFAVLFTAVARVVLIVRLVDLGSEGTTACGPIWLFCSGSLAGSTASWLGPSELACVWSIVLGSCGTAVWTPESESPEYVGSCRAREWKFLIAELNHRGGMNEMRVEL